MNAILLPTTGDIPNTLILEPLTESERQRLVDYESIVEGGLVALLKIREEGLWREYGSFEKYFSERWTNNSRRRQNQIMAGLRVLDVVKSELGDVPLTSSEFALRPLVTLAEENPKQAAEIYQKAVDLAGESVPTYSNIQEAKKIVLNPKNVERENVIIQISNLKNYDFLVKEIEQGADHNKILALVTAYESCVEGVRRKLMSVGVRDITLIRLINEGITNGSETANEVLVTGRLQFDEQSIALGVAVASDYRRLLDVHRQARIAEERESKRGQAISVVIYRNDAVGTLKALRQVLEPQELLELGRMINW